MSKPAVRPELSLLTEEDLYLFNEGNHFRLYEKLGSHPCVLGGEAGTYFALWAPSAEEVSVIGEFNDWDSTQHPLVHRGKSGIWEGFIPRVESGTVYKYHLRSRHRGYVVLKADPFAFRQQTPPETGSIVWDLRYEWRDQKWMEGREPRQKRDAPICIYEVHAGSWRRAKEEANRSLSYRELAHGLAQYLTRLGFTHVEFLPVMEHPFFGSWGYQTTGYFAPTSRYGSPQDFMYLVNVLHQHDIGVILDWVPSHFPDDEHGLSFFDGTYLMEHADPRKGVQPDWNSLIFNYGRPEVRSFLISNAVFWCARYHADCLRVDAVASMLYLDYSRREGAWVPNKFGGRENLEAISFLRSFNEEVARSYPDVPTIAEESTAWPMVSRPVHLGGLGFNYKWDMGWMHDTLSYMSREPIFRKFAHDKLTFRQLYAYSENFVLPLSHDEVVHGKSSLLGKMPGAEPQKFANLRLLFAWMYAQPGKKLLFMGGEIGQWKEWNHDGSLEWELLAYAPHQGLRQLVEDLNRVYRAEPALHQLDCDPAGFLWIDHSDADSSVVSFLRRGRTPGTEILAVFNFTPMHRPAYRVGAPQMGFWREILNSDAREYHGSGLGNAGGREAESIRCHEQPFSLVLTLPPLAALFLKRDRVQGEKTEKDAAESEQREAETDKRAGETGRHEAEREKDEPRGDNEVRGNQEEARGKKGDHA